MPGKSALVFGATGVSGWALVNEILHDYPDKGIWNRVHALCNRPLDLSRSFWPDDKRLNIVPGVDLLQGNQAELEAKIASRIPEVENITHVYYLAYKANPTDLQREAEDAEAMVRRAVTAIDHLSTKLEFIVLQTGSKMYGCHLLRARPEYITVPLHENLGRLKPPHYDDLFYHRQLDWITSYSAGKAWNWCETRPDVIVGFTPSPNYYSLAKSLAIYLALFKDVEGKGADCPFPGTRKSWLARSNDSSSEMIARQTLHISLTLPRSRRGEAFNVADAQEPETWCSRWPQLCAYFGLRGIPPAESRHSPSISDYVNANMERWKVLEHQFGLQRGWIDSDKSVKGIEHLLLVEFDFDRQYDMRKTYMSVGFKEERTVMQSWGRTFDRLREARIIPHSL